MDVLLPRSKWVGPTLSHKVLQVMPFHIVREVADIDTAILLRRVSNAGHHLFLGDGTFLLGSMGNSGA